MTTQVLLTLILVLIFPTSTFPWWTRWTPYSACSASCGIGQMTKTRTCLGKPATCRGLSSRTIHCRTRRCPFWYVWSYWSSCTASCGGGTQTRSRSCQRGSTCAGSSTSSRQCNNHSCLRDTYIHLVNPIYTIEKTGVIVAWQFYTKKTGTIHLQNFRRKRRFRSIVYDLIGENKHEITTHGTHIIDITSNEQIKVKRGDVIGFYFIPSISTSNNPPSRAGCIANTLRLRNPISIDVGDRYYFEGGFGSWTKCQQYEMEVQIQPGITMGSVWQGFGSESTCSTSCGNGADVTSNMCTFYEDVSCIGINVQTLTCDGPCPKSDPLYTLRKQALGSAMLNTWKSLGEEKFWV